MPNSIVVVGAQWGDEGKGKIVDLLAENADMVVRFAGGSNAGHTLEVGGKKLVLHLIPSGVMHSGKMLVLGDQMVICPETLWTEICEVKKLGLLQDDSLLKISPLAHLVMPYHIALDKLREDAAGKSAIGSTRRGIGPAYEFKAARCGIRVGHLRHPELFRDLIKNAEEKVSLEFDDYDLEVGEYDIDWLEFEEQMLEFLEKARANLLPYIANIDRLVYSACQTGKNVLLEGAQGAALDVDHGTYPFVTSSNTLSPAACLGSGIGPNMIGQIIGVAKAYNTRVGNGPLPTQIGGELEERLRQAGHEFGATTGRPRRVGWLDLPQLRYARRLNGMIGLFITKLDVLRGINPVRICIAYELCGKKYINMDDIDMEILDSVKPIYHDVPGFNEDISSARTFDELPQNAKRILQTISAGANVLLDGISVGPDRKQTIWMRKP